MYEDDPRIGRNNKKKKRFQTHNIGIQMKRKGLTKAFMMISNWKKFILIV